MDSVGCYFIDQLQLSLWVRTKDGCRFLLKDRERDTFIKLYALWDDEREWQHQEVADTLHLTRERIRQMEMKACICGSINILSAAKAPKKDGKGNRYVDVITHHMPLLDAMRTASRKAFMSAFCS